MLHEYPQQTLLEPEQSHTYLDLCKPAELAKEYPELFTDGQLEWLLKTRKKNGLDDSEAILKVSGKLYINKPRFFDWLLRQVAD
jgi:hypothetical protein